MKTRTFVDAGSFLRNTQVELERYEAANSLMLGVCLRLMHHPEQVKTPPRQKNG